MLHRLKNNFRLSIITLLGVSGIIGITPFAVLRFLQSNLLAAVVDTTILLGVSAGVAYAWLSGDTYRAGYFMAVVSAYGAVVVGGIVGDPGLFWLYPCLITSFFLTPPRAAMIINLSSIALMVIIGKAFRSQEQMWSFLSTALVVTACAYTFARRSQDQRRRLEHLATVDPLTGVQNRRSMDSALDMAAATAERTGLSYALVMLDLDHFKKINDDYGHGTGDEVLTNLVGLLQQNTRRTDQLFRFGGEEFVLLLPGVDGRSLESVMGNLQGVIRKYLRSPGGPVTASFGVALLRHGEPVDSWLERADDALYQAKEAGRDRIVFSDQPMAGARSDADER
ncbi:GGDEF domain-containing protein [Marinobacter sp. C2H3]|uniref:GGDEF domain-containing protein n=1 Tax=Marinobacter sp. C2H3 TaxID=3119003 RepID=UPI00300EB5E7